MLYFRDHSEVYEVIVVATRKIEFEISARGEMELIPGSSIDNGRYNLMGGNGRGSSFSELCHERGQGLGRVLLLPDSGSGEGISIHRAEIDRDRDQPASCNGRSVVTKRDARDARNMTKRCGLALQLCWRKNISRKTTAEVSAPLIGSYVKDALCLCCG